MEKLAVWSCVYRPDRLVIDRVGYRGDTAVVFLRLRFHGDEHVAVLPHLASTPHPPAGTTLSIINNIYWSRNLLLL